MFRHRSAILEGMKKKFPNAEWDLDLNSADKVLEVHGLPEDSEHAAQVEAAVAETGFTGSWIRPDGY